MSILYQGVFVMLVAEMLFFLLLLAPLPLYWRAKLIKFISKSRFMEHFKYIVRTFFIIVVILFIDSVNRSFKTQDHAEEHHHHPREMDSYMHAKLFQAQRNMYLTGSVIFLSLVFNRFFSLIVELAKNDEKTELLKQQAAKTTKEYLKLLDKEQKSSSGTAGSPHSLLQKELNEKKDECVRLTKELEIVKKQANQSHEAFMKLTEEFNELEKSKRDKKSD